MAGLCLFVFISFIFIQNSLSVSTSGAHDLDYYVDKNSRNLKGYLIGSSSSCSDSSSPFCPLVPCYRTPSGNKSNWSLIYADSETELRPASYAFDGDSSTFWHTFWSYEVPDPPHPHEIQIALNTRLEIGGFQYLPRQDAYLNGAIAAFQFFVSDSGNCSSPDWGTPIASGTFSGGNSLKTVRFPNRTIGSCIRLVALSEINGNNWTSIAELNLVDTSDPKGLKGCIPSQECSSGTSSYPDCDPLCAPGDLSCDPTAPPPCSFQGNVQDYLCHSSKGQKPSVCVGGSYEKRNIIDEEEEVIVWNDPVTGAFNVMKRRQSITVNISKPAPGGHWPDWRFAPGQIGALEYDLYPDEAILRVSADGYYSISNQAPGESCSDQKDEVSYLTISTSCNPEGLPVVRNAGNLFVVPDLDNVDCANNASICDEYPDTVCREKANHGFCCTPKDPIYYGTFYLKEGEDMVIALHHYCPEYRRLRDQGIDYGLVQCDCASTCPSGPFSGEASWVGNSVHFDMLSDFRVCIDDVSLPPNTPTCPNTDICRNYSSDHCCVQSNGATPDCQLGCLAQSTCPFLNCSNGCSHGFCLRDKWIQGVDNDGDGWPFESDCDDQDAEVYRGHPEICCNCKDDNCNGILDELPCLGDFNGSSSCPSSCLSFQILSAASKGNASLVQGNQFTYSFEPGTTGSDSFSFQVSDDNSSSEATVFVHFLDGDMNPQTCFSHGMEPSSPSQMSSSHSSENQLSSTSQSPSLASLETRSTSYYDQTTTTSSLMISQPTGIGETTTTPSMHSHSETVSGNSISEHVESTGWREQQFFFLCLILLIHTGGN